MHEIEVTEADVTPLDEQRAAIIMRNCVVNASWCEWDLAMMLAGVRVQERRDALEEGSCDQVRIRVIRRATLQEAAEVVEAMPYDLDTCKRIATAIRTLSQNIHTDDKGEGE